MKLSQLIQAGTFAAVAAFGSAHAAPNLISNGDFEAFTGSPFTGFTTLGAGASTLTGWTIGGTSVDVINNNQYGAISGNSIDMLGTPGPGSLSQTFATTAGGFYSLSFDLSQNSNQAPTMTVAVNGVQQGPVFSGTFPTYTSFTQQFQALTTSTTLSFTSAASGYGGAVLDNVSVSAVPEPSTYALMLGGLGLMGFMARRRKQG
ncbi:choice-of-anchor C family PEP-CTERM protein [Actimicrobium sp. CCI2.3]|uniref:choice-of-anchor C family PEP-CTERM protein n=1 Tax=Actimicrobium sp. CCI2.3 TaxID=3048616 RepID=UPI002AB5D944|nr:choice-of-anchor C family protein [Actimicrobium sp. CCI2.3]MDY7573164.1 choice-of-anchor C family protein [Actimicrobium sp. CCI2.3]MEB0022143.1 choice-of-anchor C family protein [Actimicrobium sp. CCI2.3]